MSADAIRTLSRRTGAIASVLWIIAAAAITATRADWHALYFQTKDFVAFSLLGLAAIWAAALGIPWIIASSDKR